MKHHAASLRQQSFLCYCGGMSSVGMFQLWVVSTHNSTAPCEWISGACGRCRFPWLPVIENVTPPSLYQKAATDRLMTHIESHPDWSVTYMPMSCILASTLVRFDISHHSGKVGRVSVRVNLTLTLIWDMQMTQHYLPVHKKELGNFSKIWYKKVHATTCISMHSDRSPR